MRKSREPYKLFFQRHIERYPAFAVGAFVEDSFAIIRLNVIFIDIILNLPTSEQNFAVLLAFRFPFVIGVVFFVELMQESAYVERFKKLIEDGQ